MKIYDISCNSSCSTSSSSDSQNTNSCTETSTSTLNIGVTYPGVVHPLLPITASATNSIIGFNILGVNRIVPNCSSNTVIIVGGGWFSSSSQFFNLIGGVLMK